METEQLPVAGEVGDAPGGGTPPRCARHQSRPAADNCPCCGRPRCAPCAAAVVGGCPACGGPAGGRARATGREVAAAVIRAGAAGNALTLIGGALGLEYVGAHVFSIVWPGLVGMVCGAVGLIFLRGVGLGLVGRLIGAGYGALSALYAFHFAATPLGVPGRWVPPMLAAAAAAILLPGLLTSGGEPRRPARR